MRPFAFMLIVLASFAELHGQSDFARSGSIREYSLSNAVAKEVVLILNEQFLDAVKFSANSSTNAIYGRVPQSLRGEVEAFIEQLEMTAQKRQDEMEARRLASAAKQEKRGSEQLKVFAIQYSDVTALMDVIADLKLSERLSIAAESRTNSVIAQGSEASLAELEALIARLDQPDANPRAAVMGELEDALLAEQKELDRLRVAIGENHPMIARLRQQSEASPTPSDDWELGEGVSKRSRVENSVRSEYESTENNAAKLATAWRRENAKLNKDNGRLRALLAELQSQVELAFRLRQTLKQFEIDRAAKQLRMIRDRLKKRESIAHQIIDRRVGDLLGKGDVEWSSARDPRQNTQNRQPTPEDFARALRGNANALKGEVNIQATDEGIVILRGKKEDVERVAGVIQSIEGGRAQKALVRGSVTGFDPFDENNVSLSIGADDGIRKGTTLEVWRGDQAIGRLRVRHVSPDTSNAEVVQATVPVEKGDAVRPLDANKDDKATKDPTSTPTENSGQTDAAVGETSPEDESTPDETDIDAGAASESVPGKRRGKF